jgi:hypothetical protein
MADRARRTVAGVWYGLIDGMAWLGSHAAGFAWFLLGATYGALMMAWAMR